MNISNNYSEIKLGVEKPEIGPLYNNRKFSPFKEALTCLIEQCTFFCRVNFVLFCWNC